MGSSEQHSTTYAAAVAEGSGEQALLPFAQKIIELTQEEHIELKSQASYWKALHSRQKIEIKALRQELEQSHAKIKDLTQRLYGKKSEKGTTKQESIPTESPNDSKPKPKPRGQQKGSKGHGRTDRPDLPVVEEFRDVLPEDQQCSCCGKPYTPLTQTEDSKIIEVHVKAHVRLIKRRMYAQACECSDAKGIITAPPAPRLIPKSSIGVSVWTEVLINKFLFSRATYNLHTEYVLRGLPIAPGTLTDGLKKIAPLFQPLMEQLTVKQLTEDLFNADETGWKVFEAIEGKVGYRWYLWVFQSESVVHYIVSPSRSGDTPIDYFFDLDKRLEKVIVVCDRYSGYKRLANENPVIVLAFCWAHVRRDFLDAARSWPDLEAWMFSWVERIGTLYHLNAQRIEQWDNVVATIEKQSPVFTERHQALESAINQMSEQCDNELKKETLHSAQRKVLESLKTHWQGLIIFVQSPQVPMDNNRAERRMRNPVTGRKNYYGSGRQWSAELAAMMFSLFQTILHWKLNPHHWLYSYLTACAENNRQPPSDLTPFIPWMMSDERKQELTKPISGAADNDPHYQQDDDITLSQPP